MGCGLGYEAAASASALTGQYYRLAHRFSLQSQRQPQLQPQSGERLSGDTQATLSQLSGDTQATLKRPSGDTQATLKRPSGDPQATFRRPPSDLYTTFKRLPHWWKRKEPQTTERERKIKPYKAQKKTVRYGNCRCHTVAWKQASCSSMQHEDWEKAV
jgi:hypothetical protein